MAKIEIKRDKCKGCRLCERYCPLGLISMSDELNVQGVPFAIFKGKDKCTGCTFCALMCPDCAITVEK